ARLDLIWNTDPKGVDSERRADLVLDELAKGAAVDAAGHFAQNPAVGDGVIAGRGARLPQWREFGNGPAHAVPIRHVGRSQALGNLGDSRLVRQRVADGHALL